MLIETKRLADLNPAAYNPRKDLKPGDPEFERIRRSVAEFGLVEPLVWNKQTGNLVGGHQRLKVLRTLGETEAQVVIVDLDLDREKALNLALNKAQGSWDDERLANLLVELNASAIDPTLSAFSREDIDRAIADVTARDPQAPDPDDVPSLPKRPVTKMGELWLLGEHRLLIGDATDQEAYQRLMNGEKASLVNTDPPYGVAYHQPSRKHGAIRNDSLTFDELAQFLGSAFTCAARAAQPTAGFYVWYASRTAGEVQWGLRAAGLTERQQIIWAKSPFVIGTDHYHWGHEPCIYAHRSDGEPPWYGGRTQQTVWRLASGKAGQQAVVLGTGLFISDGAGAVIWVAPKGPKTKAPRHFRLEPGQGILVAPTGDDTTIWEIAKGTGELHPTQKPVELARRALRNSSREGEIVLDPFAGSGFTLVAAEELGRRAYVIEIEPAYADVMITRWQRLTDRRAQRDDGAPFSA